MIKKNDIFTGEVVDFSYQGNGIAKIKDFVVFLDGGIIGDFVEFKIRRVKKNYANATITKIIKKSKDRSFEDYKESKSSLPLINYDYKKQLEWKKNKVKEDLYKFAQIKDPVVNDLIYMENPYSYRNHIQIPVKTFKNKTYLGFYEKSSRNIIDIDETLLLSERGNIVYKTIKNWIIKNRIRGYDHRTKKGILRHVGIRVNNNDEFMIILVTSIRKKLNIDSLIVDLKNKNIVSIYQNINSSNTSQIYGKRFIKLYGDDYLTDRIGSKEFKISPGSFFQVNRIQTKKLYDKVLNYLNPSKEDIVYDLYCGVGTISIYIANHVRKVYGIESVDSAIKNANINKSINHTENVKFLLGKSEDIFPKLIGKKIYGNKLILDPPRAGCDKKVLDTILKLKPSKIIYVSCNPTTLSRDINYLAENYVLEELAVIDMFPHTPHVECIALIQKKTI